MPLMQQIAGVTGQSDINILVAAAGGDGAPVGPVGPILPAAPIQPEGGQTVSLTPGPGNTSGVTAATLPGIPDGLLWAAGGLGAAYLLSHSGTNGTIGKKGKSMLVPALIVAGAAAAYWYFSGGSEDPAITARLLSWAQSAPQYTTLPATVAALSTADRATLYTIITQYFDKNLTPTPALQAFWSAKLQPAFNA